ncbi:uncharacterized protein FIBRA_05067 [Fibroporia radiculosa]|uniref:Uncharacterized protein n=1 Tax=Fibroporia radiculosa TaxID=599839 RepID=J4HWW3_9APHY|nr:uncharacterized protein FIBRA_05067 [Fibroporia radiculosa]CCM02952.1 predicted protein [Fibroporia radiculosa]
MFVVGVLAIVPVIAADSEQTAHDLKTHLHKSKPLTTQNALEMAELDKADKAAKGSGENGKRDFRSNWHAHEDRFHGHERYEQYYPQREGRRSYRHEDSQYHYARAVVRAFLDELR